MSKINLFVKKSLTSVDVAVLIQELRNTILGSKVVNVYLSNDDYVLKFRGKGEDRYLLIRPGSFLCLINYVPPLRFENKLALFRRFLNDYIVKNIYQYSFERIVIMELQRGSEFSKLIIELIPRGVMVLCRDDVVYATTSTLRVKDRTIALGKPYKYPPTLPNVLESHIDKLVSLLPRNVSLGSGLIRYLGIPPEVVNEVLDEDTRKLRVGNIDDRKLYDIVSTVEPRY